MLFLLGGGDFFLLLLVALLTLLAVPAVFFFAVNALRGNPSLWWITDLAFAAAIWFVAGWIASRLPGMNPTLVQLIVGISLTVVLVLWAGYDWEPGGWLLLLALGPVGTLRFAAGWGRRCHIAHIGLARANHQGSRSRRLSERQPTRTLGLRRSGL